MINYLTAMLIAVAFMGSLILSKNAIAAGFQGFLGAFFAIYVAVMYWRGHRDLEVTQDFESATKLKEADEREKILKKEKEQLTAEGKTLRNNIQKLSDDARSLKAALEGMRETDVGQAVEEAKKVRKEWDANREFLEAELKKLSDDLTVAVKATEKASTERDRAKEAAQKARTEMEQSKTAADKAAAQARETQLKANRAATEKEAAQAAMERAQEELDEARELADRYARERDEAVEVTLHMQQVAAIPADADAAALHTELVHAKADLEQARTEREEARVEREKALEQAEKQREQAESELKQTQAELAVLRADRDHWEKNRREHESTREEADKIRADLEHAQVDRFKAQQKLAKAEEELEQAQTALEQALADVQEAASAKDMADEMAGYFQAQMGEMIDMLRISDTAAEEARTQLEELQRRHEALQEEMSPRLNS